MLDPLVPYSRKSSFIQTAGSSQMPQKVTVLEQQVDHLNRIIMQKDETLNYIMLAFQSAQYKHNTLTQQLEQHFRLLEAKHKQYQYLNNMYIVQESEKIKRLAETLLWDLQRVLNIQKYSQSSEQQVNRVLSVVKGEQYERQSNDTSLEQNEGKKIYEVPIEMCVYRDLVQSNVQADIEPSRSFIYEIPIEFQTIQQIPVILDNKQIDYDQCVEVQRQIYTVSVQIDQVYEIPGELNEFTEFTFNEKDLFIELPKTNDLVVENQRLNKEIDDLKEEIRKLKQLNEQLTLQKDKVITIEVPVRVIQLVQTPIELQPFQVNYIQQTTNQVRQAQIQTDQLQIKDQHSKIIYEKEIIVREVPIEVVVQRLVQIPIQVQIQKVVEIPKIQIRQTPIEVVVEKQVYVQVQKMVPILVPIIKEVPIEVQMFIEAVETQKMVPIFVPIVKEIPIQVEMQIKKVIVNEVKTLVEVPVIVYLQAEKPLINVNTESEYDSISFYSSKLPQQSNFLLQSNYRVENSNPVVQKCKVFQLPIELELQKKVEVEKIVEKIVEKQIIVQKIVEMEIVVQKIVEVIVQRPIEVQKIVQKEIIVYQIVEIPVEYEIEKDEDIDIFNYEVFTNDNQVELKPTPVNNKPLHNDQIRLYFADNQEYKQSKQQTQNKSKQNNIIEYVICNKTDTNNTNLFSIQNEMCYVDNEEVIEIIMEMPNQKEVNSIGSQTQIQASLQNSQEKEISIQTVEKIVYVQKTVEQEVIKYVIKQIPVECLVEVPKTQQNNIQIAQKDNKIQQTNTEGVSSSTTKHQITIYELPIQLEVVQNQVKQRQQQLRHQQYFTFIRQKYQNEITQLHSLISQMETIIQQKNSQSLFLQERIQMLALKIQEMQTLHLNQVQTQHKEQNKQKIIIYQLPIELNLSKEMIYTEVQTQDIQLFQNIQFIEVPLEIDNIQEITIASISQEEQLDDLLIPISEWQRTNIKKIQSEIIQNQHEESIQLTESEQIITKQIANKPLIYQIPVEIYTVPEEQEKVEKNQVVFEPQVYEVAVLLNLVVEQTQVQVQTDFQQNTKRQHFVFEVPFQIHHIEQQQMEQLSKEQKLRYDHVYEIKIIPTKSETNIIQLRSGFIKQEQQPLVRIYELPIELQMTNKQENGSQITTNTCQTQNKILSITKQISINQEFKLPQDKKEQAYLKFSIFNNIDNIIISPEQLPQTPRQRQGKLQNQIVRLGSDITLNFHNSSQVQSLTAGMFASQSSYEKFPTPQINNISVIKKDSFFQGKFFGSLDMREEILSRDDPIAQIRQANRKLTGFQHQSSEGDSHNSSEQMIIEQNETIVSKDINRIQTPNLQPHDLNFSQYAKFQEKNYQNEQQHHKYIEQNELLNNKITKLNKQLQKQKEDISRLENLLDQEQQKHQNEIEDLRDELALIKKQKETLQIQIQQYKNIVEEKQQSKIQLQKRNDIIAENYQKLKDEAITHQKEVNRQVERLHNLVLQKENEVKDAKMEAVHHKKVYDHQINQLREYLIANKEQIQKLYQEIQNKNQKIDQLQGSLQQLRKSITLMKHLQTDTSAIYEQQFERIRCDFEQQKRQKDHLIEKLQTQIEQLNIQLMNEINKNKEQQEMIYSLERSLQDMKIQHSKLHHLKSSIEDEYIVDVKQLKDQIEQMKGQIIEKEELLKQNAQLRGIQLQVEENKKQMKIEYIEQSLQKKNEQNIRQLTQYTKKLESIVLKYEQKLIINHATIQQMQEKVCEYLSDALQKEQQAENLYLKLISFQNTINDLLIEKVSLELQNRKHAKYIEQAQKKLKLLGNRLIQFARQRADYDSADEEDQE